jgi:ADP-heptose:LPS heptosyltransferase
MSDRTPHNSQWVVVTFKRPLLWNRNEDEVWMFNPPGRYVLNANQIGNLSQYIQTISDLKSSQFYRPLLAGAKLAGATILIERYRERGIGDLLFMTGPMNYMNFVTGGDIKLDMYALADRGMVMNYHPTLRYDATMAGPLRYDDLQFYDYHWMVDTATEYVEEPDQLNVYDSLFAQLGFDPSTIPAIYKRPSVQLAKDDQNNLDQFLYFVWLEKKLDLRKTGYYVVAPFARGSLRSMPYGAWLRVIRDLATRRPVIVVGNMTDRMPETDMSAGEFYQHVTQSGGNVVNAIGNTPLRVMMAVISKATAVGCMDSGPLYVAQALNIPTISVWGPHDPRVRIGYDKPYMDLAVWNKSACRHAPCFAYADFPAHKCPSGAAQIMCEPLKLVDTDEILAKFASVESANQPIGAIPPGGQNA